jgi:hypothetical protein
MHTDQHRMTSKFLYIFLQRCRVGKDFVPYLEELPMTTVPVAILIQTRHPRARHDYTCKNCGARITKGTYYEEEVVRLGTMKYKDPLVHWRKHSDCDAPWWQPWAPRRLTYIGSTPKRAGEEAIDISRVCPIAAVVRRSDLGLLRWDLPEGLAARLLQSRRENMVDEATREIETVLALVSEALIAAAGNRKLALQLSHQLNELMFLARNVAPPKKRVRKPKCAPAESR